MFWNKTLLKWDEPRFAEAHTAKQLRFKDYLTQLGKFSLKLFLASYVVFLFIELFWWNRRSNSILSLDRAIISSMIVALYLFTWLITFAGSKLAKPQVSLREKGLLYMTVDGGTNIPYKKMESFSIIEASLEENEFYVLKIKTWKGDEAFIEIDPKIDKDSVVKILESKNIKMKAPLLDLL